MDCVALLNNLQQGSGGTVANVVKGGGGYKRFLVLFGSNPLFL
jgi:hypothetical protein